jgi:hypothetical protein
MPQIRAMWWLCFEREGRPAGVAIVEAYCLTDARMGASFQELAHDCTFSEGHQLDARCCARLTPDDVGRMLSPQEANALLDRLEQNGTADKRPPAPILSAAERRQGFRVIEGGPR